VDIDIRLRALEFRYRAVLSATSAAKANYLALAGEPSTTPFAIERAKLRWQHLDVRKRTIGAQLGEVQELEQGETL
jgi:hypothetical protein